MSTTDIQEQIAEEFELFDDWADKYEYIIDLGKKLPPLDDKHKVEQNIIKGCQSTVWLVAEQNPDGTLHYMASSDSTIVKGLISLLIRVLDNTPPDSILTTELFFIDKIGMSQHLAPTRANGLRAMVKQMKLYALAFKNKK